MRDSIDKDAIQKSAAGNPPLPTETMTYGEGDIQGDSGTMAVADQTRKTDRTRVTSPLRDAIRRFGKNRAAVASLTVIAILLFA
ncbi:MAG: hypothetical protein M3Z66_22470, partial [Chloroflexota bacterium]|nr:hypothetical protein [Chloroflexota bacterium]